VKKSQKQLSPIKILGSVVNGEDSTIDVDAVVSVSNDLNKEFREQSAWYSRATTLHARIKRLVRLREAKLELITAQLRNEFRIKIAKKDGNRATKEQLESYVITHPNYREVLSSLHKAQFKEDVLHGVVRALEHKRDALVGLSANMRKEMDPELRALTKALKDKVAILDRRR